MMRLALMQSSLVWGDEARNLAIFDRKLSQPLGCDLILLPEMFLSGSIMVKQEPGAALVAKMQTASWYSDVHKAMTSWAIAQQAVIMGSTVYEESGLYYNRLIVAMPDGYFHYYDKRHCFLMGGENEHFASGNRQFVFEFRGVRIAAFICYDLRFPVWCRNTQNYDVAVFVANWPESRREVWRTLMRARAIENQAFVAGVNCVGTDTNGLSYSGDSAVIDARGRAIKECTEFADETIVVDLDIADLHAFRRSFPVLSDRDNFTLQ